MSATFWIVIGVIATVYIVICVLVQYSISTTPSLEDSMAVPRDEPAYKGIAEVMKKEALVQNEALRSDDKTGS